MSPATPPADVPSAFAERLRALRVRARLTQEALADRARMTARSVSNLERGRVRGPRPATARALADALGLSGAEREAFLQLAARDYWSDRDGEAAPEAGAAAPEAGAAAPEAGAAAPGDGAPQDDVAEAPLGHEPLPAPSAAVTPSGLAADRLAAETLRLWRREAAERGLTDPRPIDVRWRWRPESPVRPDAQAPALVPGVSPRPSSPSPRALPDAGSVVDLYAELFEALPHGRLVVLGPAGAGKTGALVLLMLAALERRLALPPDSRWWLPVPVWVRAADWRVGEPLLKVVRRGLMRDHPYLAHDSYGQDPISQLYGEGRLLVLLDGLDERHPADAADAVAELDRDAVGVPLVVTCRPQAWLARPARLPHAGVVELEEVSAQEALAYLDDGPAGDTPAEAPSSEGADEDPATDLLRRPLTLAMLRREVRTAGRDAVRALPVDQQEVRLFEGLIDRAYPHAGRRARAVRRLRWLARTTPPHGAVHWWALPYGLSPLVQRVSSALGMALAVACLLLPFAADRCLVLGAVAGAASFLTLGLCNGRLVISDPGGPARNVYLLAMCPRFHVNVQHLRLYGVGISWRPFRVRVGLLNRGAALSGHLTIQGGGEPTVVGLSWRGRQAGLSGTVVALSLVGALVVESTAGRLVIVAVTALRILFAGNQSPSLKTESYDPRRGFRLDALYCLGDLTGTAVTLVLVATGAPGLSGAMLGTAVVCGYILGLGPSVAIQPALVALALRGVWVLPPVGVLEADRAAGLLRRVGTAYEFRHEELRQALAAGRIHP